ncbi:hypothetical protein AZF37_04500 [endosymbiont 'TC1' of Trimyema compressum]|uniref:23S rRNA (adenine(2503)-C(2))-methyltransferase RlmN n=1 Tax=endosymbiont 'TC1' of Trimyema compressum TaxID=243899 RepID=UPI0007F0893A|nr:23S rRNA (adenine(2503)-C(2))-methyltransferase RlmN [endosymbiont 'TC1' of Trimyema compressum]AMP20527.1 hypothetical protein AZF37_04500 [endosymbiont 'TC1' of Trimyema compressum]
MDSILNFSEEELQKITIEGGFPSFRSKQLYSWLYDKSILDLELMSNLDRSYKSFISNQFKFKTIEIIKSIASDDRQTIKLLLELCDKETVEIVIMRYPEKQTTKIRNTLCISSQIGCQIACPFCATGQSGFKRNLTTAEILEQLFLANNYLRNTVNNSEKINNIVFMGMGEPFLNWEAVKNAATIMNTRFKIGERRITISTSGVTKGIEALADLGKQWVLAISLHGSNNQLRDELVPINKKYPLEELIQSCRYYMNKANRRITFEYIMIHNKNIGLQNSRELGLLLKGLKCHINGIPLNETEEYPYKKPSKNEMNFFRTAVEKEGISFSIREEKGQSINGACGQLRNQRKGLL